MAQFKLLLLLFKCLLHFAAVENVTYMRIRADWMPTSTCVRKICGMLEAATIKDDSACRRASFDQAGASVGWGILVCMILHAH